MFCPFCGNQNRDGKKFCRTCGRTLPPPRTTTALPPLPEILNAASGSLAATQPDIAAFEEEQHDSDMLASTAPVLPVEGNGHSHAEELEDHLNQYTQQLLPDTTDFEIPKTLPPLNNDDFEPAVKEPPANGIPVNNFTRAPENNLEVDEDTTVPTDELEVLENTLDKTAEVPLLKTADVPLEKTSRPLPSFLAAAAPQEDFEIEQARRNQRKVLTAALVIAFIGIVIVVWLVVLRPMGIM